MLWFEKMKSNDDIFAKNKFGLGLFVLTFLFFIFSYWKNSVGLFFDIPSVFTSAIFELGNTEDAYILYWPNRARLFNNVLVSIPFNLIFFLIKDQPIIYWLKYWSASYFLMHFFGLLIMYLSARRTKRYDIAVVGFLFYSLLCIPNAIWAIREIHISIPFYFSLLAYFLSREKFKLIDILPISLLSIYMFESFETSAILGLIFFIFSNLYIVNKGKNDDLWKKLIIGFWGILYAFYIPIRTIYLGLMNKVEIGVGLEQWINGSIITFNHLFSGNLIITCFAFLCVIIAFIYKKQFNWKSILIFILPVVLFTILTLYLRTRFIPDPKIELHYYSIVLWFLYPVFLIIILLDYFEVDILRYNKFVFSNLIIVASLFGILNLSWQIHSFYEFGKYEAYLKNLIDKSNNVVVNIPQHDFNKYTFLNYNMCFGTMLQAIFLTEKGQQSKIIFPSKYFCDYSKYCFDDYDHTYYDKSENILYIQTALFKIKTRYWDLSNIVNVFKKQGRVKNL